ncbi:helix-turn-helix transcriptional regulator [Devosia sp.]|uniref:helix-turn-helix transcriptional regulator n=1 Tax=Devosia sp. TaxID=1871048 RepID=UPI003BAAF5BC
MAKRSERLLALMQSLRRRRRPVSGQVLADELGVSLRSLYRDIATLKSMGAAVGGEAGLGFQLRADYFLPPLTFTNEEVEALVLGLRTLVQGPDDEMSATARDVSSKLSAVLPAGRRDELEAVGLFAMPRNANSGDPRLGQMRRAIREELQVSIQYRDAAGAPTDRIVYPIALGYFRDRQVLIAWCTLRMDWRQFRIDRVDSLAVLSSHLPEPRRTLFHRWRTAFKLPDIG